MGQRRGRARARRGDEGARVARQRARAREHRRAAPRARARRAPHARPLAIARRRAAASAVTPVSAAGDPGPGHPLRARVEAFERTLIAEAFEAREPQPERDGAAPRRLAPGAHREAPQVRAHRLTHAAGRSPSSWRCSDSPSSRARAGRRSAPAVAARVVSLGPGDDRGALRHRRRRLASWAARATATTRRRRPSSPPSAASSPTSRPSCSCARTSSSAPRARGRRASRRRSNSAASRPGSPPRSPRSTASTRCSSRWVTGPGTPPGAEHVVVDARTQREARDQRSRGRQATPARALRRRAGACGRRRARRASPTT